MVIIESAPDPLEPIFRRFEKDSGWEVSQQARTILRAGLASVDVDTLGLGDFAVLLDRGLLRSRVVEQMPKFLEYLQEEAESGKRNKAEKSQKTIGGIFVLQHMGHWKILSDCTCWPV